MKYILHMIIPVVSLLSLLSCGSGNNVAPHPDSVYVADVYKSMFLYGQADSAIRAELIQADSTEIYAFMSVVGEMPVTPERIEHWSWSLPVRVFTPAVDSIYSDTDELAIAIGNALARLRAKNIELPDRHYAAVVWGKYESMMFVQDTVMLIALNHYLGAEYDGYSQFPLYKRLVKEPQYLPYDITEALVATQYPYVGGDNATALSRMLYEGALTMAKIQAVDGGNAREALAYRPEQYQFLKDEEKNLWAILVQRNYLYDTSLATIDRLIYPAPACNLLDERAPGRAGRYIGYRIVESYLQHNPDATLPYLLSPEFYNSQQTLALAQYNP